MVLPASGSISASQMRTEFTLTNPVSFSHVYNLGPSVPTSGTVSMSGLRGKLSYPKARYVRLRLTEPYTFLNLGEVEVYNQHQTIISRGRPVTQSSVYPGTVASTLTDNDIDTVVHSDVNTSVAWVEIDLGSNQYIRRVLVFNRRQGPHHCLGRIKSMVLELRREDGTYAYTSDRFHGPSGSISWSNLSDDGYYYYDLFPPSIWVNAYVPKSKGDIAFVLDKYPSIWGTASNFIDPNAYFIWNQGGVQHGGAPSHMHIKFSTHYYNATGSNISAVFHVIIDNYGYVMLNDVQLATIMSGGWTTPNYTKVSMTLLPGVNYIDVVGYNEDHGGAAGFIGSLVRSSDSSVILRTNDTWLTNTIPKYDVLSSTGKSNCRGLFGLNLLRSNYSGPIFTLRRSGDNFTNNVYADVNGVLTITNGASLSSWATSDVYISTWYDQSPNGRHATQGNWSLQPRLDLSGYVDFKPSRYLNLPDGTVPSGNSTYTVITKHLNIYNGMGCWLHSGTVHLTNGTNTFRRADAGYHNYWWYNDHGIPSGYAAGNIVAFKYDGSNRYGYINRSHVSIGASGGRNSTTASNMIGSNPLGEHLNGELYYLYIFQISLWDEDYNVMTAY